MSDLRAFRFHRFQPHPWKSKRGSLQDALLYLGQYQRPRRVREDCRPCISEVGFSAARNWCAHCVTCLLRDVYNSWVLSVRSRFDRVAISNRPDRGAGSNCEGRFRGATANRQCPLSWSISRFSAAANSIRRLKGTSSQEFRPPLI